MENLTLKEYTAFFITLLMLCMAVRYCYLTAKQKIKPVLASWIIITVSLLLAFATFLKTIEVNFIDSLINNIIVAVGFPQALVVLGFIYFTYKKKKDFKIKFKPVQKASLLGSVVIVGFWIITKDPRASYIINQGLMLVGVFPTAWHLWKDAKENTEDVVFWVALLITALFAIYPAFVGGELLAKIYIFRSVPSTALIIFLMLRIERKNNRR